MAVLQNEGRKALARAIAAQAIHLAWGRGLPAWDAAAEPEPVDATALVDEIGRRAITAVDYVTPDPTGEVQLATGNYTASATPTKWLHLRWNFDFADAEGETVRELGIFLGTVPVPDLPAGQRYFLPAEIQTPGDLYCLERLPKFVRNGAVRQVFEYVLPF